MANFEVFSSLKANIEKCEVCWLGKSKYRGDKPGNCKLISLVTGSIKILGVHFSLDKTLSRDKNFLSTCRNESHHKNMENQKFNT